MEAIKTQGLTKAYKGLVAVDGLNLTVQKGELFSLLLRIICSKRQNLVAFVDS